MNTTKSVFRVSDDLMKPTLFHGDEIACMQVDLESLKYWSGYIHYVVFDDGQHTIKRLYDKGDNIFMKCDGDECGNITVSKNKISEIYRVIASLRMY